MGLDPGIRTGVKVAVVDGTGKVVETTTVYPFPPKNDIRGTQAELASLIRKHKVELISIGNGTGSRETEKLVADMLAQFPSTAPKPTKVIVSEAGASVYSASETAAKEFPNLDVSLRAAPFRLRGACRIRSPSSSRSSRNRSASASTSTMSIRANSAARSMPLSKMR